MLIVSSSYEGGLLTWPAGPPPTARALPHCPPAKPAPLPCCLAASISSTTTRTRSTRSNGLAPNGKRPCAIFTSPDGGHDLRLCPRLDGRPGRERPGAPTQGGRMRESVPRQDHRYHGRPA